MTAPCPKTTRWSHEQIRATRLAPLAPLLRRRGLQLIERPAANLELPAYPGLLDKDCCWRWPARNPAGNTIDFCIQVLGFTFAQAMHEIIQA